MKPNNDYRPLMLPINAAAERYGLSAYIIRKWALSGTIKAIRAGNKVLVNCDYLEEYLNNSSINTVEQAIKPISAKLMEGGSLS
ncbi:MAG TPA: helix-turn-helix domain-containing protein [Ruminococcus sp.]|nr:helix-turn-helix domain-containing protein [Ruminococcus sp.]